MDPQQQTQPLPTNPPLPPPKPRLPLLLGGLFVSLVILGGSYYLFSPKQQSSSPVSQTPPPTAILTTDPVANWRTYEMSDCLVTFRYPPEWEGQFKNKGKCWIDYSRPAISPKPIDTFVVFDVQPETFMGVQNIEIDEGKVISRSNINGIEKIVTYSEEKALNLPILLAGKDYFFKKGSMYFRIISQYEKDDNSFEQIIDRIADSVIIKGDFAFYEQYLKNLESGLPTFTP